MAKKSKTSSGKKSRKRRSKPRAAVRTIGVLHLGRKNQFGPLVETMREAAQKYLTDEGSSDTVRIYLDGHYADGDLTLLDKHADDLVKETSVKVIVAAGGPQSALAAMDATNEADEPRDELPVVFTTVADPEGLGLVEKESAPAWNLTGMAGETSENDPKRMALLREYMLQFKPDATKIGVLVNRSRQGRHKQFRDLKKAAEALKLKLKLKKVKNNQDIADAFRIFARPKFFGAVVTADGHFNNIRDTIIVAAAAAGVPTIYQWKGFVEEGGLISYGPSIDQAYKKAGEYVGRILHDGDKPADMPCSTPSGFELWINKAAATNLGLPVPAQIGGIQVKKIE